MKHAGYARWFRAFVALVFLVSTIVPAFMWIDGMKAYAISPEVEKVIGGANKNLSAKFSFDEQGKKWQFNKNGTAALAQNMAHQQGNGDADAAGDVLSQLKAQQVGGGGKEDTTLYSVDMPVKSKEGITYYDNVNKLSFKMVPDFGSRDGKLVQDRIVYPFGDGAQVVYTAKTNGLKEDIVLSKYIGDTLRYSYDLQLPQTLEARLLDDGSIGIYSANIALFGNITFSNDEDKSRVMEARKTGTKDNLVFNIPAPFIQDQSGRAGSTKYLLNDNRITVVADGLKDLKYPLTVDPSVTVTTSSDFEAGVGEDAIEISTANQINRAQLTGGTLGAFTQTAVMNTQRALMDGAVYNGYIYAVGSWTNQETAVEYAKIQPDGSLGAWTQQATGLSNRYGWGVATYNGYIYMTGGMASTPLNTTSYAKLNPDGSLGTVMTASTTFNTGRYFHKTKIYNGYIYVIGGRGDDAGLDVNTYNSTRYAKLKANGDIDTWVSGPTMPTSRLHFGMSIYNNRMYVAGGFFYDNSQPFAAPKSYVNNIISAYINEDGSFGPWTTNVASIPGMEGNRAEVYAGYMYIIRSSDMSYAPVSLNGQIGTFESTTAPLDLGTNGAMVIHNGYLYKYGGGNSGNDIATASYAKINPAGSLGSSFSAGTNYDSAARASFATATYNNYVYVIGGTTGTSGAGGTMLNNVRYALANANGTLSAWSTASATFNNTSGAGHACNTGCNGRVNTSAAAYNGFLYIAGGVSNGSTGNWSDVQRATICTGVNLPTAGCTGAGDLRGWTTLYADFIAGSPTTYSEANGRAHMSMTIYNGIMYLIGGASSAANVHDTIYYATLNADGSAGSFALSGLALPSQRKGVKSFAVNNKLYIVGGGIGAGWATVNNEVNDVQYALINQDGTVNVGGGWKDANAVINGGSGSSFAAANALDDHTIGVSNSQLYVAGGKNSNNEGQTTVYRATINSNGSIGTWGSTTPLTTARYGHGTVAINGQLYVTGGCAQKNILGTINCNSAGQMHATSEYATMNNGGNGNIQSTWNATSTALTTTRYNHGSFIYNGYLYVLGGRTNGANVTGNEVLVYAPISQTGVVGPWATLVNANPPALIQDETWAFHNGYVYKLGGKGPTNNAFTTTQYAAICTGTNTTTVFGTNCTTSSTPGTISGWINGAPMTTGRSEFNVVAHNGYLYALGGCLSSAPRLDWICKTPTNTVEVSQINATTGAMGTWSALSAGNNFATPRFNHKAVAHNGYVYVIGGCANIPNISSSCDADLFDIQVAKLNGSGLAADAGCGSVWCKQDIIVGARMGFGITAYNGYMYISGGAEGPFNDVQMAPILPNGGLGNWAKMSTGFTTPRGQHQSLAYDGKLYIVGGINEVSNAIYGDVQFASLNTIPRISKYSKLLTISPTTEVSGVYYNGLLNGNSTVQYRVAPSSGIFGSFSPAVNGTGSEPTPLCGMGSIYYVQLMVTLNDTTTATYPESNVGNITDMTTYYRITATPPPNLRMTGGKWFYEENQRPLDTCKQ